MLVVNENLAIPLKELDFRFSRSSGPGGQRVNKVNTKVTLFWDVSGSPSIPEDVRARFLRRYPRRINKQGVLLIVSQRFRDRGRNVADCLEKLRFLLQQVAVAPRRRKKTRPTAAARQRRLQDKQAQARKKQLRKPPTHDQ